MQPTRPSAVSKVTPLLPFREGKVPPSLRVASRMRRRLPRLKKEKKKQKGKKKDKKRETGEDRRVDRKVKVRVKGLCGSNEPSRATIPPSPSGVEFERMEKDARALFGLEWSESSTWLAGDCGMVWLLLPFSGALAPPFLDIFLEFL